MPTKVDFSERFERDIRRLKCKYLNITKTVREFVEQLEQDERLGDKIPNVGYDVYKVRLPNLSAQRGKSGGFRVVYYLKLADSAILLTIYAKTEQINIAPSDIQDLIEALLPPNTDLLPQVTDN